MNKYIIVMHIMFIMASISYGGKALEQLEAYKVLDDLGVLDYSNSVYQIGSNILERCKSDEHLRDETIQLVKKHAQQGDITPALGFSLYLRDFAPAEGKLLLVELSEGGSTDAMVLLSVAYYKDDVAKALRWLRKAADLNDVDAIKVILLKYEDSISPDEYMHYVHVLIDLGHKEALVKLGMIHLERDPPDIEGTINYLRKAWDGGVSEAAMMLSLLYKDRDRSVSLEWMEKGAEAGDSTAQYEWANQLLRGELVTKDEKRGIQWLHSSAEGGYAPAQRELGRRYFYGRLVQKNRSSALRWYEKAADQDDALAQYDLASVYAGQGNGEEAYIWFWLANQNGVLKAAVPVRDLEGILPESVIKAAREKARAKMRLYKKNSEDELKDLGF